MRRVRGGDLGLFLRSVMINVIQRHRDDVAVGRGLKQEAPHDLGHPEERRECHPYRTLRHVGARQPLGVDVGRGLFVEPEVVQRLALEALAPALIRLQADYRYTATIVPYLDAVEQVRCATRRHQVEDGILRNGPGSWLPRSANKNALYGISRGFIRGPRPPSDGWLAEALTLPPIRVTSRRVHGRFHAASEGLPRLVCST